MSTLEKKQIDIILKLNWLTLDGKIEWAYKPAQEFGSGGGVEVFTADYRGRRFVLRSFSGASLLDVLRGVRPMDALLASQHQGATLDVYNDGEESPSLTIPPMPATNDLVDTIKQIQRDRGQDSLEQERTERLQDLEELDRWLSEEA